VNLELAGKRALVTGASRGIGAAVARALAAEGVHLALLARGRESLEAVANEVRQSGVKVVDVPADTTDDDSVRAAVERVESVLGGVDVLVNAAATPAGPGGSSAVTELADDDLRVEIETKVLGYLRTARAVVPGMKARGWGRIINVSGLAARQAGSTFGSIRNVAVAAMTKNLGDELGAFGINVTVVHPALTVTERTPALVAGVAAAQGITEAEAAAQLTAGVSIGRMVTADEVASVIAFLASPRSIAINGDAIAVGGGARGAIHY
jgi:NAD(P)-dependent dehydrogenase (short-subunit alcohol dehydrogenase family)